MKYIGIENAGSEKLVMHLACKECDAELTGLEKFCPQCGRKLDKKEKGIPLMKAVELLDKTDKAEKAIEMLDRVHNWLGELIRDSKCDDHCSKCIGASDLADDIWDVLHLENNKTIDS